MEDDPKMLALYASLAQAQGEFRAIVKNRTAKIKTTKGYSYDIRYADLEEINAATRPYLSKNGLSVLQPLQSEAGEKTADTYVETMLLHKDGGRIVSRLLIRGAREFADQKEFASEVSYMRRYAITSLLNLAADDDAEQNGRGLDDKADPMGKVDAETRNTLDAHLAALLATTDDKAALDYWNANKAKFAASKPAYDHFKDEAQKHRTTLRTMTRPLDFLYKLPDEKLQQLLVEAMLDPQLASVMMSKANMMKVEPLAASLRQKAIQMGMGAAIGAGQ